MDSSCRGALSTTLSLLRKTFERARQWLPALDTEDSGDVMGALSESPEVPPHFANDEQSFAAECRNAYGLVARIHGYTSIVVTSCLALLRPFPELLPDPSSERRSSRRLPSDASPATRRSGSSSATDPHALMAAFLRSGDFAAFGVDAPWVAPVSSAPIRVGPEVIGEHPAGLGVYATRAIPSGTPLLIYGGTLFHRDDELPVLRSHILRISDSDYVIDGVDALSLPLHLQGAIVNSSLGTPYRPNVTRTFLMAPSLQSSLPLVVLQAVADIAEGEFLHYPYSFRPSSTPSITAPPIPFLAPELPSASNANAAVTSPSSSEHYAGSSRTLRFSSLRLPPRPCTSSNPASRTRIGPSFQAVLPDLSFSSPSSPSPPVDSSAVAAVQRTRSSAIPLFTYPPSDLAHVRAFARLLISSSTKTRPLELATHLLSLVEPPLRVASETVRSLTPQSLAAFGTEVLLVEPHFRYLFAGHGILFPAAYVAIHAALHSRVALVRASAPDAVSYDTLRLLFSRLALVWGAREHGWSSITPAAAEAAFAESRFFIGPVVVELERLNAPSYRPVLPSSSFDFVYTHIAFGDAFEHILFAQALGARLCAPHEYWLRCPHRAPLTTFSARFEGSGSRALSVADLRPYPMFVQPPVGRAHTQRDLRPRGWTLFTRRNFRTIPHQTRAAIYHPEDFLWYSGTVDPSPQPFSFVYDDPRSGVLVLTLATFPEPGILCLLTPTKRSSSSEDDDDDPPHFKGAPPRPPSSAGLPSPNDPLPSPSSGSSTSDPPPDPPPGKRPRPSPSFSALPCP